ncbi:1,6-anhydro-N-acetylmuramyl-L-alanine amidase AmpD [Sulfurivirga sp.]|uniref:1,6-anhydro-N-acetylmuramyl-L-alanine amidase AmpD n=1 Tax=Sulfurivirga sp. TaxID=2614236 RepID=UPI0025F17AEE|nr:1,6-anhydro-N-acetylmuramyl-L-alanine amidase AmpD [Sulfurivirga sp.]
MGAKALSIKGHWLTGVRRVESPNQDDRPPDTPIELVVIHGISLPPNAFGGPHVEQLFTNRLDPSEHPYFAEIAHLRVSAHLFIRRDGELVQFVPFDRRAWHAGVSSWRGRSRCNDFSIGIELEGADHIPYTAHQYRQLNRVLALLRRHYPIRDVVGHSHIAPGRKTDPGPAFDWQRVHGASSELVEPAAENNR